MGQDGVNALAVTSHAGRDHYLYAVGLHTSPQMFSIVFLSAICIRWTSPLSCFIFVAMLVLLAFRVKILEILIHQFFSYSQSTFTFDGIVLNFIIIST